MSFSQHRPPELPSELLEGTDLEYLKPDELYFSALRNRFGLFYSENLMFQIDSRVKYLQPILELMFANESNNQLEFDRSRNVLDVGCGQGNFLLTLNMVHTIPINVGIDISAKKLKTAISNLKNLKSIPEKSEEDKNLTKEVKNFLNCCPKNIMFEEDLKLFDRFFETVKQEKSSNGQNGKSENKAHLKSGQINFKLQSIFNFESDTKFRMVFCLRITKWVFLTLGETSLNLLLNKCLLLLSENGVLVLSRVERNSFKSTARAIHKKKNSSQLLILHQSTVSDFVIRNELIEINRFKKDKHLQNGFLIFTRKENRFWKDELES